MLQNIGTQSSGKNKWTFYLWAPQLNRVELKIVFPEKKIIPMEKGDNGYWKIGVDNITWDTRYFFRLEKGNDRPDPVSHWQPDGVHGPSQIVDHSRFKWNDSGWKGIGLYEMIMYELHVGTFTQEGTLEAVINRLDELRELGINALSIMPVAQFPGERNWGYDTAYPFAVQDSYGGPDGLKTLVNACHKRKMAVILDVVYNHLGPEGNYLGEFAPYFTDKYTTPWGMAVNFDQAFSDGVRNYFIQNALHWFRNYHIDALRLDAVHAIIDMSAYPFLAHLAEEVEIFSKKTGRNYYLIAESDLNDARILRPREQGGMGIDAQWNDDFHHALHALLTGEKAGYYRDFGEVSHLAKALSEGYVITWQYSDYRKRHHGSASQDRPAEQFVVFSQNHDQVGNRMKGERLSTLVSFEALKLTAGLVILSPYIPLLFMGEEYGEEAPFLYFVSHSDPDLIEAVRQGRAEEFGSFNWKEPPPDPQNIQTFNRSKLNREKRTQEKNSGLREFYQYLIQLRKTVPALYHLEKKHLPIHVLPQDKVLIFKRNWEKSRILIILNFNEIKKTVRFTFPAGKWKKLADSSDHQWRGPGSLLPEYLIKGEKLTLRPASLSIYQEEMHT